MKQLSEKQKPFLTSARIIPIGFLVLILFGTLLLLLPFSTVPGEHTSFLTALFTATTSVCVTGLVVVDTYAHWTLFGKIVILLLIQFGGLGLVAVSSAILLLLGKNVSIRNRVLLRDSFNLDSISGQRRFLFRVVRGVLFVEGLGTLLYLVSFVPRCGFFRGLWYSVFHSVSAFCNAGLDLIGPDSLAPFSNDPWLLSVTMLLIVLGGLGYIVWFDLSNIVRLRIRAHRKHRLSEHTRLVLCLTAGLIVLGAALVSLLEWRNPETLGRLSVPQKILQALFESVTLRTAGFSVLPQQSLREPTALLACFFMFVGGSPVGTAGGVKTVTMFLLFAGAFSYVQNRNETVVCRRTISSDLFRKASAIVLISLSVSLLLTVALLCTEGLPPVDCLFEVFSATGTVGLSRGVTASLSPFGRCIIILGMYLGRIGPISLALFFGRNRTEENRVQHANGQFYVG